MPPSPAPKADGARRPAAPVIVRAHADDPPSDFRRVGPAGLMSAIFHLVLLGLFVWLAPRGHGAPALDAAKSAAIEAEPEEPQRPELPSVVDLPFAETEPRQPTLERGQIDPKTVWGESDPLADSGSMFNEKNVPNSGHLPPPGAFPSVDRGSDRPEIGDVGVAPRKGPSGGVDYGKREGTIGAAGFTPKQAEERGVTPAGLAAVAKGLKWLAAVQSSNGCWKLDGNFPDKGNSNDVAGAALGLLPFLAAGKTHAKKNDPYAANVAKALDFLIETQDRRTGAFSRDFYSHGLATIAMSEAFALSGDYKLRKSTQAALNYIVASQHPGGGWRYQAGQAGDTSVTGWQIMALKSGLMAGLDVPRATLRRAQTFLDEVVDPATEGSGYTGPQPTPTMTAVSLLCRQYLNGWGGKNPRMIKAIENHLKPNAPRPGMKDAYFYYYATQVMHNFGGDEWKAWNVKMREQLIASQAGDESQANTYGSWSPAGDRWGGPGGRLMVTSLNLLTLEVYYRYLPLYYREGSR